MRVRSRTHVEMIYLVPSEGARTLPRNLLHIREIKRKDLQNRRGKMEHVESAVAIQTPVEPKINLVISERCRVQRK